MSKARRQSNDTIEEALFGEGRQVGYKRLVITDSNTFNGSIPMDDTIPQITEGSEIASISYTPKRLGSKLIIRAVIQIAEISNTFNQFALAVFQNSETNAIGANYIDGPSANPSSLLLEQARVEVETSVLNLNSITFSLRGGAEVLTNWRVNGLNTGRVFGGVMQSFIEIIEISQG